MFRYHHLKKIIEDYNSEKSLTYINVFGKKIRWCYDSNGRRLLQQIDAEYISAILGDDRTKSYLSYFLDCYRIQGLPELVSSSMSYHQEATMSFFYDGPIPGAPVRISHEIHDEFKKFSISESNIDKFIAQYRGKPADKKLIGSFWFKGVSWLKSIRLYLYIKKELLSSKHGYDNNYLNTIHILLTAFLNYIKSGKNLSQKKERAKILTDTLDECMVFESCLKGIIERLETRIHLLMKDDKEAQNPLEPIFQAKIRSFVKDEHSETAEIRSPSEFLLQSFLYSMYGFDGGRQHHQLYKLKPDLEKTQEFKKAFEYFCANKKVNPEKIDKQVKEELERITAKKDEKEKRDFIEKAKKARIEEARQAANIFNKLTPEDKKEYFLKHLETLEGGTAEDFEKKDEYEIFKPLFQKMTIERYVPKALEISRETIEKNVCAKTGLSQIELEDLLSVFPKGRRTIDDYIQAEIESEDLFNVCKVKEYADKVRSPIRIREQNSKLDDSTRNFKDLGSILYRDVIPNLSVKRSQDVIPALRQLLSLGNHDPDYSYIRFDEPQKDYQRLLIILQLTEQATEGTRSDYNIAEYKKLFTKAMSRLHVPLALLLSTHFGFKADDDDIKRQFVERSEEYSNFVLSYLRHYSIPEKHDIMFKDKESAIRLAFRTKAFQQHQTNLPFSFIRDNGRYYHEFLRAIDPKDLLQLFVKFAMNIIQFIFFKALKFALSSIMIIAPIIVCSITLVLLVKHVQNLLFFLILYIALSCVFFPIIYEPLLSYSWNSSIYIHINNKIRDSYGYLLNNYVTVFKILSDYLKLRISDYFKSKKEPNPAKEEPRSTQDKKEQGVLLSFLSKPLTLLFLSKKNETRKSSSEEIARSKFK